MKKILCVILSIVMVLSLAACGDSGKTETPAANDSPAADTPASPAAEDNSAAASSPVGYYSLFELTADGETQSASDFEALGITYYLVVEENGTGFLEIFGEKQPLTWDEKEFKIDDIGAMSYTYADDVIKLDGGEENGSMTFARLTGDKLTNYMENGSGNPEDFLGGLGDLLSSEGERFENEGDLEGCHVKFLGAEALEDGDGKDAVRVWYEYTNTSDKISDINVYLSSKQGENELEWTYLFDDVPEAEYSNLSMAPGLTIRCAQLLNYDPEGGDIEFSLGGWFGDSVYYVVDPKNMPGAPADSFTPVAADADYKLDGISASGEGVEILGSEIVKDYAENDVILFHIRWTNNGDEEDSFIMNYNYFALQDGYGLTQTSSDSYADEQANYWQDTKPGESIEIAVVYNLRGNSNVTFAIEDSYAEKFVAAGAYPAA